MGKSPAADRLRRGAAIALIVGLFGAAVGYFLTVPGPGRDGAEATPAGPRSTSSAAGTAPASGRSDPADPASPASPVGRSSASGPGLDEPGVSMVASPREDGTWDVVESVRLKRASSRLDLSRAEIGSAGGEFAGLRARALELQASAGDELASVVGSGAGRHVEAAAPSRVFVLRYVLDGATVRSVPSKAGRALSALAPIADPGRGADQVQIVVTGDSIRALQCPLLDGDAQLCAGGQAPRWTVRDVLPRSTAVALVQFDLPRPQ